MTGRMRIIMGTLICALASSVLAQVPAGIPFDSAKHPNPIVTWVEIKNFKVTTFAAAVAAVGVDTMSLSQNEGRRESVELASPSNSRQRIRMAGEDVEVTFYPVMRQNYKLKSGHTFVLYTFRFPRALTSADVLNAAAFGRPVRGVSPRFGSVPLPDRIEIRGNPGLYFENPKERSVYWFELGAAHSATTDAPKDEFFEVLDDLL
jgi:hypothetical protein